MKKLNKPVFLKWTVGGSCVSGIVDRLSPLFRNEVFSPFITVKEQLSQEARRYISVIYRGVIHEKTK